MAKDLKLDDTGDFDIDENTRDFNFINSKDELKQKITLALNTNLGELDWDENFGINFLELNFNAKDNAEIERIVNDYLNTNFSDIFELCKVNQTNFNKVTRNLKIDLSVQLKNGINFDTSIGGDDSNDNQ